MYILNVAVVVTVKTKQTMIARGSKKCRRRKRPSRTRGDKSTRRAKGKKICSLLEARDALFIRGDKFAFNKDDGKNIKRS